MDVTRQDLFSGFLNRRLYDSKQMDLDRAASDRSIWQRRQERLEQPQRQHAGWAVLALVTTAASRERSHYFLHDFRYLSYQS